MSDERAVVGRERLGSGARRVPPDDVRRVVGRVEHALEEVVSLDFQKRVVGVYPVSTESL